MILVEVIKDIIRVKSIMDGLIVQDSDQNSNDQQLEYRKKFNEIVI